MTYCVNLPMINGFNMLSIYISTYALDMINIDR